MTLGVIKKWKCDFKYKKFLQYDTSFEQEGDIQVSE